MPKSIHGRVWRLLAALVAAPLFFTACAQTQVVDSWQTDEVVSNEPGKVAVVAMLPDALTRKAFEIDVAKILADKGTPAIPSSNISGFSGGIRGEIDVEVATGILRNADVDGIVVMFYSGGGTSEGYVRSDYGTDRDTHPQMYLHAWGDGEVLYLSLGHCSGKHDMKPLVDINPVVRGSWNSPTYYELLRSSLSLK